MEMCIKAIAASLIALGKECCYKCFLQFHFFSSLGDCKVPPDVPNAQAALSGLTSFPERHIVTYKCNEGFVKVPGKPDSVICLKGNEWSQIAEFCNRKFFISSLKSYGNGVYLVKLKFIPRRGDW